MLSKKKVAAVAATAAVFGLVGIANATWLSSGSGSGTAKSTTAAASAITADAFAADLYPGATKSVTVDITNPNDYPIVVTSISSGSSAALTTPACAAGTVTSDGRTDDPAFGLLQDDDATRLIAGGGSASYELTTNMIANPADTCQDREFTLALTATIESAAHVTP